MQLEHFKSDGCKNLVNDSWLNVQNFKIRGAARQMDANLELICSW